MATTSAGKDWVVLSQALCQSIKEEEWIETHEKLKEVSKKVGVKKAGERVGRPWTKEAFFSATEEQVQAFDRRCGGLTSTTPCECVTADMLKCNRPKLRICHGTRLMTMAPLNHISQSFFFGGYLRSLPAFQQCACVFVLLRLVRCSLGRSRST